MIRLAYKVIILSLIWCLAYEAQANDINTQLETIRQQHLDALQLSLNYPDKGRRVHSKVASQLEALMGEERIDQGILAYNIGNSWFHAGRYGESILWYLRAEQYGLDEDRLQQNLDYARNKRLDNLPDLFGPVWLSTLYEISGYGFWLIIAGLIYVLFWWQLWRYIHRGSSEKERFILVSSALLLVLTSLSFQYLYEPEASDGVILVNEVEARKGPGLVYAPAFTNPLNAGTEVVYLQQRGRWLEVSLSDGQIAWLPENSLESVQL